MMTIGEICELYKIKNYQINEDMTVDVNSNIYLSCRNLTTFPLKFGKVSGYFICSNNNLTSLEGCPLYVGDDFSCYYNTLTTLENCPEYVGGNFFAYGNPITTLEYGPKYVGGVFSIKNSNITNRPSISIINNNGDLYSTNLWKF